MQAPPLHSNLLFALKHYTRMLLLTVSPREWRVGLLSPQQGYSLDHLPPTLISCTPSWRGAKTKGGLLRMSCVRALWGSTDQNYSGTLLLWTLRGPGEVSCLESCPHFRSKLILRFGTQQGFLNVEVSIFQGYSLRDVPLL